MFDSELNLNIYPKDDFISEFLVNRFNDKNINTKGIANVEDIDTTESSNYLVLNLTNIKFIDSPSETQKILALIKKTNCKTIVIFPQYVSTNKAIESESFLDKIVAFNSNLSIILSPYLLGSSVKRQDNNVLHEILFQSVLSDRIKIKDDSKLINCLSLNKFCDRVVRETFSFGTVGSRLLIVGEKRLLKTIVTKYLGYKAENIIFTSGQYDISEIKSDQSVKVDFSLMLSIKKTLSSFLKDTEQEIDNPPTIIDTPQKVTQKKRTFKFSCIYKFFAFILLILSVPLILILVSLSLILLSYKTFNTNSNTSQNLLAKSIQISQIASCLSFGNNFYFNSASLLGKTADLSIEGINLVRLVSDFENKIMNSENYNINYYTNNISASLDKIHTNLSFLQTDLSEFGYLVDQKINITDVKQKVYETRTIASRLSLLLGADRPMKYLVLFQNNMELRPTGGFIGSYAMLTFDKGKLSEINISDIYSADGQLKGHVDPPEPIRKHLGEGGWYMRDANWDPDFVKSSQKIEWFLEKEVNEKVDGIIAIDLSFVKDLLKITGPINLVDFNKKITFENLYSETQSEVEDNFFPGSIKKASFLTSLSKSLIFEVENLSGDKKLPFFKEIYKNLEEKHIQVYLHDKNSQKSLSNLGFTGEVDMDTTCEPRCINDRYQLIDANLGVNKANLFVTRSQTLNTTISKNSINHELTISYDNKAGNAIGKSGSYKTYTRLVVPKNATILGVRVYESGGTYSDIEFDQTSDDTKNEIGFLVEVMPSSQKLVQIAWNIESSVFDSGGEYNLFVEKQAGTDSDNLKVIFRVDGLTLTGKPVTVYNTNLIRDFKAKLFLK